MNTLADLLERSSETDILKYAARLVSPSQRFDMTSAGYTNTEAANDWVHWPMTSGKFGFDPEKPPPEEGRTLVWTEDISELCCRAMQTSGGRKSSIIYYAAVALRESALMGRQSVSHGSLLCDFTSQALIALEDIEMACLSFLNWLCSIKYEAFMGEEPMERMCRDCLAIDILRKQSIRIANRLVAESRDFLIDVGPGEGELLLPLAPVVDRMRAICEQSNRSDNTMLSSLFECSLPRRP